MTDALSEEKKQPVAAFFVVKCGQNKNAIRI